ncbi:MAG TPA: response regulator [Anaerolineales bacterium]|nr:response regulator [Anaerolineales bacterium]
MTEVSKRVVYIEDEPEMVELVQIILGRAGFEVAGAGNGLDGLQLARREPPDLVLLDLMLPDMDGWQVYRELRADESLKHIPVIVITAKSQSIDMVLGLHVADVDDYISKPFSAQELVKRAERVIAQQAAGKEQA